MHLIIIGLILATISVIFIVQNTAPVIIYFLFWKFEGSLALILFLTFLVSIIISLLVAVPFVAKRKEKTKEPKVQEFI